MNKKGNRHPEDFSPYLDRDFENPRYEEIRAHLTECPQCVDELGVWQKMDSMFRSQELQIEVPAFQWQRIAARLEEHYQIPVHRHPASTLFAFPSRLVWSGALALILMAAGTFGVLEYRKSVSDQRILSLIAKSAREVDNRQSLANPFQAYLAPSAQRNPFEDFRYPDDKENPFSHRQ